MFIFITLLITFIFIGFFLVPRMFSVVKSFNSHKKYDVVDYIIGILSWPIVVHHLYSLEKPNNRNQMLIHVVDRHANFILITFIISVFIIYIHFV